MSREELSNACRTAAEALQILSNVNPAGILNRVEANVSRQMPSSLPNRLSNVFGGGSGSNDTNLESELADRFPTVSARRSRKRRSTSCSNSAQNNKKKQQRGRKSNDVVFKDLVFIPDPEETDVPTHKKRLELEEQNFVIHEFPFNRLWSATTLKEEIRKVLPPGSEFEFMKVLTMSSMLNKFLKPANNI